MFEVCHDLGLELLMYLLRNVDYEKSDAVGRITIVLELEPIYGSL